jgi:HlyD family type I secretion membrane fusion protein
LSPSSLADDTEGERRMNRRDNDTKDSDASPWLDLRASILGGTIVIGLVFGGLIGWAATAPLASAVIAPGAVVVEGKRKLIQHLEGGIVERILIEDGQQVAAGQLLLRLDETHARSTFGVLRTALDSARILEARLLAERDGAAELNLPSRLDERRGDPTVAEMMRAQQALFAARRTSLLGQQEILRQRIASSDKEITGLEAQQVSLEEQGGLAERELKGLRDLLNKGLAPLTKVLALEREAVRLKGSHGERIADIARAQIRVGETQLQILQADRAFSESVAKEVRDVQTQIADLEERLGAARGTLDHIDVRAPAAGIVVGLTAYTVGGVIKAGETIMEIVPGAQRLIVEAQVQPNDIDNVALGMDTDLRLSALKQRTTPTLRGRLVYVSADRLTDPRTGQPYYLARAEFAPGELSRIAPQVLQAGMPAEVKIKTRERTALAYLLQPMVDAMGRSWRED